MLTLSWRTFGRQIAAVVGLVALFSVGGCALPWQQSSANSDVAKADNSSKASQANPHTKVAPAVELGHAPSNEPEQLTVRNLVRQIAAQRATSVKQEKPVATKLQRVVIGDIHGVHELPPTFWAVQLATVRNIEHVATLVQQHNLRGTGLMGVPVRTATGDMHAVLLGVYKTREAALSQAQQLPEPFANLTPWVRPLEHLQASVR